ncbi:PDZ domain-containing protein [soil metagenome]
MRHVAFALILLPCCAFADVHYTLTPKPLSKSVTVSISVDNPGTSEVFHIPAWCPGFYFLQKYESKIFDVNAIGTDGQLAVTKSAPNTWSVANPTKQKFTISYRVLGDDPGLGFFGVNVRNDQAFTNGAATFMYADGRLTEPCDLKISAPMGWDIATAMTKDDSGKFTAKGYDEFIDMPIQMGTMKRTNFTVGDLTFNVAWVAQDGSVHPDITRQTEVLRKVSAEAVKLFNGAPFKHYQYIFHLTSAGFLGGLEHRGSTTIALQNDPSLDVTTIAAHEFFHTWNVKNIRPRVLGPFDYTKEVRTGNLWFAEGVTDYYAQLNAYRSGIYNVPWLYQTLSAQVAQLQSSNSRLAVTLDEACRKTWESGGFGYKDLDYYNKGLLVGLLFDSSIRGASKGQKSLDDLMRLMYAKYRLPNPGYGEDGIRTHLTEVAGIDENGLYDQAVRSKQELPYGVLKSIGLRVVGQGIPYGEAGFTTIGNVVSKGSGLVKIGDFVLGVTATNASKITVNITRDGQPLTVSLPYVTKVGGEWIVEENPFATVEERERLLQWLGK